MKRIEQAIVGLFVLMFALTACNKDDTPGANTGKVISRKVAIVMPASEQGKHQDKQSNDCLFNSFHMLPPFR